ncbi:HAMP domain-containing protein [Streptomyces sp. RPT161]|uniref:HAMP domain-containing protein n=1 Tax=Streptomyces sp. RPT161 TaxID=3015993 RepID=UPI0022B92F71|nr:HAMP domain-containing protein [Streptomyces sp. RPT161]
MRGRPALPTVSRAPRRHRTRRRADMPLLGGVRPPIASFIVLLLVVAALTVAGLGSVHGEQVPQAVLGGEQQTAADIAVSVRTAIDAEATTVRRTGDSYTVTGRTTPAQVLKSLAAARKAVLGGALLDTQSGRVLATGGERVPLTGVDAKALTGDHGTAPPRLVTAGTGQRMLYFANVTLPAQSVDANQDQNPDAALPQRKQWLLVVSEALPALTSYGDGRTAQVLDAKGNMLATAASGMAQPLDAADLGIPSAAVDAAVSAHGAGASGSLLGATSGGRQTVAGWASVASSSGTGDADRLGLVVLTFRPVPVMGPSVDYSRFALVAAGVLAGIALLVGLLLQLTVQRPLLRLYLSADRLARGAGESGPRTAEDLARPVPVHGLGEPARIGRALESLRRQLLGESGPEEIPVRRGPGCRALAVIAMLLVAAWAAPLIFLLNRADTATAVPAPVVADQQARTEIAANRIRQSLGESYTDLSDVAKSLSGTTKAAQTTVLGRTLADHHHFRSLYLIGRTGAIVLRVGKTPLRTIVHVPGGSGITTVNTSGRIPAIAAYAQIPVGKGGALAGGGVVLFGEIDVNALNSELPRPKLGGVWVTDANYKVLAASIGYRAFEALPGSGLTRLATSTQSAPGTAGTATSAVLHSSSGPSVAAAAPLAQSGPTVGLGWRVVTAEPAAALQLPAFQAEQRTMLAGVLGLTVGVACLGWLHIVVIRPLRTMAVLAERLAGGDRRTVLYPVNHDEAGSVTRSLELIRQALAERGRGSRSGHASAAQPGPPAQSRHTSAPQR